jgi:hypothetical protein
MSKDNLIAKNIKIFYSSDFWDGAQVCYPIIGEAEVCYSILGIDLAKSGGDMHSETEFRAIYENSPLTESVVDERDSAFTALVYQFRRDMIASLGLPNDWKTFRCSETKKVDDDLFAEANLTKL